ncbi:MAG: DUF4097 family beta strand repeat-containing protein [Acidobacteriaceae bacterium]
MRTLTLLPAAALVLLSAKLLAADHSFERTLSTSGSPNVSVSTGSGNVRLKPGSDNQVHISGHLHAGNGWFGAGDVESRMNQIAGNPPIVQNGNDIIIGERHSGDRYRNISIDYEVTLPRASSIEASTGSGDVDLQDVGTKFKGSSGSGNVRAVNLRGEANLETGSGDIELNQGAPGDVRAQTGSGNIRLNSISGGLRAGTGSGDIEVSGNPATDWKLDTGSGSVRLTLGSSAHFNLSASTGSGTIRTQQPIAMQGEINRHHVSGTVNGGGPALRINTGSGDVDIK